MPPQPEKPAFNKRIVVVSIAVIALVIIAGIIGYIFKDYLLGNAERENPTTTVVNLATPTPTPADNLPKSTLYKNEQFQYEFEYPTNWEVTEAKPRIGNKVEWAGDILLEGELQKVTFTEEEKKDWPGEFQIRVMENSNNDTVETWIENNKPKAAGGANLLRGTVDTVLDNSEAKRLSIFGFDREITELVALKNGYIYKLIFDGENPNDPDREKHQKIYEKMVSSFKFTK